ncbi:hypothetical protein ACFYXS_36050 [Streptomyces sp. NPDC002574]|uniref:hypothetical protein n=1 Tax=Streptomyces sp. NPDC002574 TaxID=3364652 RepID=UPI003677C26E
MSFVEGAHKAFASVMRAHSFGMVSRLVFVVELVDEATGELGLLRGSCPGDMPVWSELGLHRYAVADIEALGTASRVAGREED